MKNQVNISNYNIDFIKKLENKDKKLVDLEYTLFYKRKSYKGKW